MVESTRAGVAGAAAGGMDAGAAGAAAGALLLARVARGTMQQRDMRGERVAMRARAHRAGRAATGGVGAAAGVERAVRVARVRLCTSTLSDCGCG
jgi:hypothetical protein